MSKWNLIFDVARCNSCNNCVLATKDEYLFNSHAGYSAPAPRLGDLWFQLARHERGAAPMMDVSHYITTCHQCDDAPCMTAATADCISKRQDGIVMIDPEAAKGRRDLVGACPYGQIFWNEEQNVAQKWSFDAHLLDAGWTQPRCAQTCPTGAIEAVKIADEAMAARVAQEQLEQCRPELGTKPRIWYRNFDRVSALFLGGTVVRRRDGVEDCADGMDVALLKGGSVVARQSSDAFGDFKFAPVPPGLDYHVRITDGDGSVAAEIPVQLSVSRHIGIIEINP